MFEIDLNSPEYLSIFLEEITEIIERLERQLLDYENNKDEEINKGIKRDFHTLKGDFMTYGKNEYADFFHNRETVWKNPENRKEVLITKILEEITKIKKEFGIANDSEEEIEESTLEETEKNEEKHVKEEKDENIYYEIIIDFKGEKIKEFEEEDLKGLCNIEGKLYDYSYVTDNLPDFSEFDPEKIYLKIRLVVSAEDIEILKNGISEIIDSKYIEIRQGGNELLENKTKKEIKKEENINNDDEMIIKSEKEITNNVIAEKKSEINIAEAKSEDAKEQSTIRVNTEKLDNLVNIVGELIVAHSSLRTFKDWISENRADDFEKIISDLDNITKSMQEDVLSVRMIPIGNTFIQFKRMIRDLAKKLDKKIKFDIKGGETEIDKTIIEKIVDPLRHMIRNSIDHGIESSTEREAKGKSAEGTIKISAYHQGGEVIIEIEDDGKGLDKEKILEKAISNKLISPNTQLPNEDIFALVFEPGFSTKESVTELSGRGVGMDVVKNNIDELGGKVEIDSEKDKGAVFKIRLPLTLAIIDGMLVKVGDHIYAIPILSIVESLQPKQSSIKNIKGKSDILEIRGEYYPLIRLESLFGISNAIKDPTKATVIVVETYKGKMALMVDDVIDNQQIVIKKINLSHKELGKFSGATILGTGEVALILDIKGIYDTTMKKSAGGEIGE